jgi:transposase InsO family protein
MEAIPLVETSACSKALTFSWISCFGVPETITSDRGPQFTSNLCSQLCSMLNIALRQTTAYYPESNGAVERLHRCLKDALCAHATAATWAGAPRSSSSAERRHWSFPAESVFGAPVVLPNEFLQCDELAVDSIIKNLKKKH